MSTKKAPPAKEERRASMGLTFYLTREDCSFGPGKYIRHGKTRPTPAIIASSALKMRDGSTVDVPAVADIHDDYFPRIVVHTIHNPVVPNPNTPTFPTLELATTRRPRLVGQFSYGFSHPLAAVRGYPADPSLGAAGDRERVYAVTP